MSTTRLGPGRLLYCQAAVVVLGATLAAQAPRAPHPIVALVVSHTARAVAPGEMVLMTISAPVPLASVSGQAFGRPLAAFPGDQPAVWQALVGIDLATKPGAYAATIEATTAQGAVLQAVHRLTVVPKTFGVRRLRVPAQFVTPPASALPRIEREQKRLAEVYSRVSELRLWHGPFKSPADGAPVSNFGVRSDYNGKQGTPHRGTDFAGATGAPVKAPNGGRVVLAADLYFSGNTVIVDHGLGLFSVLMHLSRIDVHEGDLVAAGAIVGAVGATGRVTGPHLHWSVRVGAASVDPLSLIAVTAVEKGEKGTRHQFSR